MYLICVEFLYTPILLVSSALLNVKLLLNDVHRLTKSDLLCVGKVVSNWRVLQLVDLKAELLKKQQEFRQQKLQTAASRSLTVPKVCLHSEY